MAYQSVWAAIKAEYRDRGHTSVRVTSGERAQYTDAELDAKLVSLIKLSMKKEPGSDPSWYQCRAEYKVWWNICMYSFPSSL